MHLNSLGAFACDVHSLFGFDVRETLVLQNELHVFPLLLYILRESLRELVIMIHLMVGYTHR